MSATSPKAPASANGGLAETHRPSSAGFWTAGLLLLAFWLAAAWLVNPAGEFALNDDWSYWQALQALKHEGRIAATGWAGGGISLISHLAWGGLFTSLLGESMVAARLSVMVMGLLGSLALLLLLRAAGASAVAALAGALTLAANPLFFSQSFTFMTDVTCTSLAAMALWALYSGVRRASLWLVCLGLLLCATALLTRQLAVVLVLGFLAAVWLHPMGRALGRWRLTLLTIIIALGPWLAWEWVLASVGGGHLVEHQLARKFTALLFSGDPKRYLDFAGLAARRLVLAGMGMTAFFVLPALLLSRGQPSTGTLGRRLMIVYVVVCLEVEGAALAGLMPHPSQIFLGQMTDMGFGNVLMNLGIGPLLFKDTYLLGVSVLRPLHPAIWDLAGFLAAPAVVYLVVNGWRSQGQRCGKSPAGFLAFAALISGWVYLAALAVFGFHDRYLMLAILLFIVWLLARPQVPDQGKTSKLRLAAAGVLLCLMAGWAVGGTHDLMATERAAQQARLYAMRELKVPPCRMDGGFAFNGLHCHDPSFVAKPGLSWWWVHSEDYLVALSPLKGYQVVQSYRFQRWLGPDGKAYLLKPDQP